MSEKQTVSSVLKNRGFLNLWVNQILVQLSSNALNFALIIWVFKLTDSNIAVSLLLLATYLPSVLLGLFSGVLVDITDRKKIILFIDFFLCLAFISLIFLKMSFPAILVVTFIINTLGQLYGPAEASAIPIIVKKNQLLVANSMFSSTFYFCFLLGFGFSGPLINHLSINFVFGIGAILLATAFLLALAFPSIVSSTDEKSKKLIIAIVKKDYSAIFKFGSLGMFETLTLIRGKLPVLTSIAILSGIQVVTGVLAVLIPGFLEKSLQIKATDASYVLVIPLALGIITGGILLGRFGYKLVKRVLVSRAILFAGLVFFIIGIAPIVSPAIKYFKNPIPVPFFHQLPLSKVLVVGSFLMGMAMVSILVPSQTVLQENTPEGDRGKVFSVLGAIMSGVTLIPIVLSGILADLFGTTPIFIGLGIFILLVGLFGLNPSLFLKKDYLSFRVREFLGLGHWDEK